MKMSLKRKLDRVQVRAGRVLRVVKTHKLTGNLGRKKGKGTAVAVIAEPGDLVVEIVGVKAKKVLGHAYLTGTAMRFNQFDTKPEWFTEADTVCMDIRPSGPDETSDQFWQRTIGAFMAVKYRHDAGGFEHRMQPGEGTPEQLNEFLGEVFGRYKDSPQDGQTPNEERGHVFGVIYDAPPRKGCLAVHYRPVPDIAKCAPAKDTSDRAASIFQIKLAVEALTAEVSNE